MGKQTRNRNRRKDTLRAETKHREQQDANDKERTPARVHIPAPGDMLTATTIRRPS